MLGRGISVSVGKAVGTPGVGVCWSTVVAVAADGWGVGGIGYAPDCVAVDVDTGTVVVGIAVVVAAGCPVEVLVGVTVIVGVLVAEWTIPGVTEIGP